MSERPDYEKAEKMEKEEEKEREKAEKEEKSWEEKWRRDPLSIIVWAAILIWAGLVFLASNFGLLDKLEAPLGLEDVGVWATIFVGAGLIVLLEVVARLLIPAYRRPVGGTLISGAVLLGIGLGWLWGRWELVGALVLIAVGVGILVRSVFRRR